MKKLFFVLVCAMALMSCNMGSQDPRNKNLEECDNVTYRCWEMTTTASLLGVKATETSYVWCTEYMIVATIQEAYKYSMGVNMKITYKVNPADTEEACEAQNEYDEDDY